jgi:hypothetical protein
VGIIKSNSIAGKALIIISFFMIVSMNLNYTLSASYLGVKLYLRIVLILSSSSLDLSRFANKGWSPRPSGMLYNYTSYWFKIEATPSISYSVISIFSISFSSSLISCALSSSRFMKLSMIISLKIRLFYVFSILFWIIL